MDFLVGRSDLKLQLHYRNIAFTKAVFEAEKRVVEITVTPDQLKLEHPRRDELAAEVFGAGTTAEDDTETELSVYNVNKFTYRTVVPKLPEEIREHVEETAEEFQELMEQLSFIPNSPTLMNAGDELQQLSTCFVDSPTPDAQFVLSTQTLAFDEIERVRTGLRDATVPETGGFAREDSRTGPREEYEDAVSRAKEHVLDGDISDIHQTAKEAAEVFQSGGGIGIRSGGSDRTATPSGAQVGSPLD